MDNLYFNSIDQVATRWLERSFEKEEILEVVKSMASDKASGSYGFSIAFYQACWDVVGEEFMNVFSEFYATMKFEKKNLNDTFIALIFRKHSDCY